MIFEASGNLLAADADALVNTVNTEGVMGKGIALQFKKAFPAMFDEYRRAAKAGEVRLGSMHVWPTGHMSGPQYVINFPTKGHWKSRSRLADIDAGLIDLVAQVEQLGIKSIAVPPLGCGNGGLAWPDVRPRIVAAFARLPEVKVLLFAPTGSPAASDMTNRTETPSMTTGRAALIELVAKYTRQADDAPGLIESQKLMYFLQEAGEPLRLKFAKHLYGPYADNLRHVLIMVEGHFLSGFGDGTATVADAERLSVLAGATEAAEEALRDSADTRERINRVLELAEGFESAYGLELLSTVHWLASHGADQDAAVLANQIREWSPRKARMFTEPHVRFALTSLREQNWLPQESTAA